ncbi:MAG: tRNA uridine-5-carboxymethylaminomethyl(34) synthesis GTPase MnmE [Proteobacteria bacterium]|nr:tRNA uridine-5-carboxymethylaminomethyl(34) synthesis GTPase MnmE [Pseudomonadota bacterium]
MKVNDLNDTIAAIATPSGEGGIGIIRISGPDALSTALKIFQPKNRTNKIESHRLYYGEITDPRDLSLVDESLLSFMKSPSSFTMEDVVELNCHGGSIVLQQVMELLLREGLREAEPGEFSKRAFLNGRIDLTQAEAVIDLIRAKTERGLKLANRQLKGGLKEALQEIREGLIQILSVLEAYIDFPEEEIDADSLHEINEKLDRSKNGLMTILNTYEEGKVYREGIHVVIAGRPNVGKSSLLNRLLKEKRAIVTSIPGTTRDMIEEVINIKGIPVNLIDTAGIRETTDVIESEGIKRTKNKLKDADLILYMIDDKGIKSTDKVIVEETGEQKVLIVINKEDQLSTEIKKKAIKEMKSLPHVFISTKQNRGVEQLKDRIYETVMTHGVDSIPTVVISRKRHKIGVEKAIKSIERAQICVKDSLPYELISSDLRDALFNISEVAGETTTEEVMDRIFSEFCIGK